jgi:8-oxo-dGTP pyrophosphatase MutT (NUDIX family)
VSGANRTVFSGKTIEVNLETASFPDGRKAELEIVRHPGGAAVVAIDADDRVCLIRHYRYAAGGWLWEIPAGRLEQDEPPTETAARELAEEAGIKAARWGTLGTVLTSPGVFTEVIHLFAARDLSPVPRALEQDEYIEVHWVALDEALGWARAGEIRDAKTLVGIFRIAANHAGVSTGGE